MVFFNEMITFIAKHGFKDQSLVFIKALSLSMAKECSSSNSAYFGCICGDLKVFHTLLQVFFKTSILINKRKDQGDMKQIYFKHLVSIQWQCEPKYPQDRPLSTPFLNEIGAFKVGYRHKERHLL